MDPAPTGNENCPFRESWRAEAERVAARIAEGGRISPEDLLVPLRMQTADSPYLTHSVLGEWREDGRRRSIERFVFQRTREVKRRIRLGIFAGIHGDEPAGILGLMDFVRELDARPLLGKEYELFLYPLCNPGGFEAGTRESPRGLDLNRQFWRNSPEPEVRLLEAEIRVEPFDGIIALHSDDTSAGFYGFARDRLMSEQMLAPALEAAAAFLPRDESSIIDGFHAVNGIIHSAYDGILTAPPGRRPEPFEVILESPHLTPMDLQRRAFTAALEAILQSYREFIAYGGDL